MHGFLTTILRFTLGIFYRRLEIAGLENVPRGRGVVFALNHPNGLVDPLFVLCHAPRRVSFLAKAPLFRYPVIGWIVRALDCIPVYRKQDEVAGSNAETFARARAVLKAGQAIAIFPEGTTHSDPRLRELKTGAARIALGSAASGGPPPVVVPAGIYYAAKQTFRSDAMVAFGEPIEVPEDRVGADGEPLAEEVAELTRAIDAGLARVTLQADSHAALALVTRAEDIFSAADPPRVAEEFTLRRRFVDGYHRLREHDPGRLAKLASRIEQFSSELGRAGLEPHELEPRFRPQSVLVLILLLPVAVAGAVLHLLPYRIVDALAPRLSKGEDELAATVKFLSSLLLYPLTWLAYAFAALRWSGWPGAAATLATVPLTGYVAMRVFEKLDVLVGRFRALTSRGTERLVAERDAIRREIMEVAEEMPGA